MKKFLSLFTAVALLIFFVASGVWAVKTWKGMYLEDCTIIGGLTDITGGVTAGEAADVQRSFTLFLPAGMQDGGNDLDDASTPTLTEIDNVPAIVWDSSAETTIAQWTFRLPPDFVAGGACGVYALVSSSEADGTDISLDYSWFVNNNAVAFDAVAIPQTAVACTSATLDTKNEVVDLSANATAIAAFTAGTWVTFELFNGSADTADSLEVKGLEFYYQSTQ